LFENISGSSRIRCGGRYLGPRACW